MLTDKAIHAFHILVGVGVMWFHKQEVRDDKEVAAPGVDCFGMVPALSQLKLLRHRCLKEAGPDA